MIQLEFYSLLRLLLKREKLELPAEQAATVGQLLQRAQQQLTTPFLFKLLDEQGELIPGTMILLNRKNILHLDKLNSAVRDGDVVALFPPGAGG